LIAKASIASARIKRSSGTPAGGGGAACSVRVQVR
jgi:hypothetical protein